MKEVTAMKNSSVVLSIFLILLAGCAERTASSYRSASFYPSASPAFTDCERNRGVWHANLGTCEVAR